MILSADFVENIGYDIGNIVLRNKRIDNRAKAVGYLVDFRGKVEHRCGNLSADKHFHERCYGFDIFNAVGVNVVQHFCSDIRNRIDDRVEFEICARSYEMFEFYACVQTVDFVKHRVDIAVNAVGLSTLGRIGKQRDTARRIIFGFGRVFGEHESGEQVADGCGNLGHVNSKIEHRAADFPADEERYELLDRFNVFNTVGVYVLHYSYGNVYERIDDRVEFEVCACRNEMFEFLALVQTVNLGKNGAYVIVVREFISERREYVAQRCGNLGYVYGKIDHRATDLSADNKFDEFADRFGVFVARRVERMNKSYRQINGNIELGVNRRAYEIFEFNALVQGIEFAENYVYVFIDLGSGLIKPEFCKNVIHRGGNVGYVNGKIPTRFVCFSVEQYGKEIDDRVGFGRAVLPERLYNVARNDYYVVYSMTKIPYGETESAVNDHRSKIDDSVYLLFAVFPERFNHVGNGDNHVVYVVTKVYAGITEFTVDKHCSKVDDSVDLFFAVLPERLYDRARGYDNFVHFGS